MFWKLFANKRKAAHAVTWLDAARAITRAWGLRISGWLQRKTERLSPGQLKRYSVLILLIGVGWNGWIIVQAVQRPHPASAAAQPDLSHSILPAVRPAADPSSLAGLHAFRSWLDSLQTDSAGRKIYDSIRQQRPGLLDSLKELGQPTPPVLFK